MRLPLAGQRLDTSGFSGGGHIRGWAASFTGGKDIDTDEVQTARRWLIDESLKR